MKNRNARLILGLVVVVCSLAVAGMAQQAAGEGSTTKSSPTKSATTSVPPPPATITGSGTAGFLPDFTGAATIGKSAVFQSGASPSAKIGINTNV